MFRDEVTGKFTSSTGLGPLGADMPAKSAKQERFMQAVAHGMKPKKGMGPSPEVARKFLSHGDYRGEKNGKRV